MRNYEIAAEYWSNLMEPPPLQRRPEDDPRDSDIEGCTCPPGKIFRRLNIGDLPVEETGTQGMRGFMWWCAPDNVDPNARRGDRRPSRIDRLTNTDVDPNARRGDRRPSIIDLTSTDGICGYETLSWSGGPPPGHVHVRCDEITTMGDCIGRTGELSLKKCGWINDVTQPESGETCSEIVNRPCLPDQNGRYDRECSMARDTVYQCSWTPGEREGMETITGDMTNDEIANILDGGR
jgi:hypothetical protein